MNSLQSMMSEQAIAPKIYTPSIFWQSINQVHVESIKNHGIKYFKHSINKHYFDWGVSGFRHQLLPLLSELSRGNVQPFFQAKLVDKKTPFKRFHKLETAPKIIYPVYIGFLYDYVSRIDRLGILKKLSEPSAGSPLVITYRGQHISQDLCNSVQEFYSITQNVDLPKDPQIAEIGAGYGRLAYVFLRTLRKASYCIIDIPPALYISQEYLKNVFPNEKIFSFRPFKNFKEVEKEFKASRIKFLMPHQIEFLPEDSFDLIINISSFHEMATDQIKNYFKQVDRLSSGYMYTKQWKRSWAVDNKFIEEHQYPVPKTWETVFHQTHPIQRLFFEALYKTGKNRR